MTDRDALLAYRLKEAEETLADARTLLENQGRTRTIINRAYYAMFYAVLAVFIRDETTVRSSKHAGVIALFDKEMIHSGKLPVECSRMLHRMFDARQEADYKEFVSYTDAEARKLYALAESFLEKIRLFLESRS
jgi:uncharacterized protein (UPF0332 family)